MAESSEGERPQVIAVTANVYDCDKENCAAVGMCNFIGKPVKINLLKDALAKCSRTGMSLPVTQIFLTPLS